MNSPYCNLDTTATRTPDRAKKYRSVLETATVVGIQDHVRLQVPAEDGRQVWSSDPLIHKSTLAAVLQRFTIRDLRSMHAMSRSPLRSISLSVLCTLAPMNPDASGTANL